MAKQQSKAKAPAIQKAPSYRWVPVALICIICVLYGRTLNYRYVKLDDSDLIVNNYEAGLIKHTYNIVQLFRQSCFEVPNQYTQKKSYYRPVLILSFMADAQVNGALPGMFHFMNLLYHILATLLLYTFMRRLNTGPPVAFALCVLFAIHPVNVHAIGWIPGRNDMLLAIFSLLSFIALIDYHKENKPGKLVLHLAMFALALFTKESGIILMLLYVLFMWLWQKDVAFYRRKPLLIPGYLLITTVWFLMRRMALSGSEEIAQVTNLPQMILHNLGYFALYIGKIFLPFNLSVTPGTNTLAVVLGVLSFAGLVFLISQIPDRRKAIFGISWFLLFLAPTLLLPDAPAYEHRDYLPLAGLLVCTGQSGYFKDFSLWAGKVFYTLAGISLVFFVVSFVRVPVYENAFTFWEDATQNNPFAATGDVNLGKIYQDQFEQMHQPKSLDIAYRWYRKALDADSTVKLANNNFGAVLYFKGQKDQAAKYFQNEIRLHPENLDAWQNMGVYYRDNGQPDKSVPYWQHMIQQNKYYLSAYEDLMTYYTRIHDLEDAKKLHDSYLAVKTEMEDRVKKIE